MSQNEGEGIALKINKRNTSSAIIEPNDSQSSPSAITPAFRDPRVFCILEERTPSYFLEERATYLR